MIPPPTVRFAPSPTGRIHIGNARTALLNWLYARRFDGTFILRFDCTDFERSKAEFAEAIEQDLNWLGIAPDRVFRQSERLAAYDEAADRLKAQGRLYPAYETAEELERRRKRRHALGRPLIHDRAALRLSEAERSALEAAGRRPLWRFRLEQATVRGDDLARGESHIDCASLSDPVLRRKEGTFLYTLPSVVDDIEFGVTDVIRGEDHVTNTAVQIQIFEALAAAAPRSATTICSPTPAARGFPSAPARNRSLRFASGGRGADRRRPRRACRFGRGGAPRRLARRTRGHDRPFAPLARRGAFR